MSTTAIMYLISFYSAAYGMDPAIMKAVAFHESGMHVNAVGLQREVGLYQIKSEYIKEYSRNELFNPEVNIRVGIGMLSELKKSCGLKKYLVCFNGGKAFAKHIQHPEAFPYVLTVNEIAKRYARN